MGRHAGIGQERLVLAQNVHIDAANAKPANADDDCAGVGLARVFGGPVARFVAGDGFHGVSLMKHSHEAPS
jgi:hypothetical protein